MRRTTKPSTTQRRHAGPIKQRPLIVPRLFGRRDVAGYINQSPQYVDQLRVADPSFPKPIYLRSLRGPNGTSRIPLWDKHAIDKWIDQQQQQDGAHE